MIYALSMFFLGTFLGIITVWHGTRTYRKREVCIGLTTNRHKPLRLIGKTAIVFGIWEMVVGTALILFGLKSGEIF